jgi:heme exporter protein B
MYSFKKIFLRDCFLYWRNGALARSACFCLLCASLFVFSMGLEKDVLQSGALSILWIVALLSCLLSFDLILREDFEDGTLDQYAISCSFTEIAMAKVASYWCSAAIPVLLVIPILAILMGLSLDVTVWSMLGLAVGTLAFCCIGTIGAALTVSLKRGGLVIPFLVLPLCTPVLLLGTQLETAPLSIISLVGAITLFSLVIAPVSVNVILKVQYK